jgi:hypothetical protein
MYRTDTTHEISVSAPAFLIQIKLHLDVLSREIRINFLDLSLVRPFESYRAKRSYDVFQWWMNLNIRAEYDPECTTSTSPN